MYKPDEQCGEHLLLSQLLPVQTTEQFAIILVELPGPHIKQYRVFVVKTFPAGTSGVWVLQSTVTALSKSNVINELVVMHLVCFGPTGALSGLM